MCGLCGVITTKKLTNKQYKTRQRIIDSLLISNESRGDHSTGVALIGKEHNIFKRTIAASDFIFNPDYIEASSVNSDIVIGHTRFATTGKVTEDNAHPFIKGSIIGAHNGILSNHVELDSEAEVDSEAIFTTLNGHNNDFVTALPKIKGSFALAWHDLSTPDNLYLFSHLNPLSIAMVPELNSLFWSSEYLHLVPVINAAVGLANNSVLEIPEDVVYTINKSLDVTETPVKFPKSYNKRTSTYKTDDTVFDSRYMIDDFTDDDMPNYRHNNGLYTCVDCGFEFDYDSVVFYDYTVDKIFCSVCQAKRPMNTIERMKMQEYKRFSAYE